MLKKDNLIVGLDIGTTKICTIIGEVDNRGEIDIIGLGLSPSHGLRKGVVIDLESTVESIKRSVHEAETMSGTQVDSVYVGIAGGHIRGFNSRGVIAVMGKNREITQTDIDRVIDAAKAVALPMDREVIHILPQEYIIDNQDKIKRPLGMSGVRLEAEVHIVTGAVTSAQNLIKCANRAGLDVCDIILQPLASSEAVLTSEERNLGVALVDFGGGTTDMAIFSNGSISHTSVLALGGDNLTYDIAIGLRTPKLEAEKIKIKYGCALSSLIGKDETIEVPGVGGRKPRILSRQVLGEILEPRVEEIFSMVYSELVRSGHESIISSGIVLTGGSAELPGSIELAEQIFNAPSRVGYPQLITGLVDVVNKPMYATAVGLVIYGGKRSKKAKKFRIRDANIFNRVVRRMKKWFKDVI